MPKPTFFNLSPEKRDLLVRLAIDEFANNDYESASISRIVAQAGIAKGSFYQYFEDKRDLYQYLLDEGLRLKAAFFAEHPPPDPAMHPFAYLRWLLRAGMGYEFSYAGLARIAQRAVSGQGPFPPEWGAQVEAQTAAFFRDLIARGMAAGQLRADLDLDLAAYICYASTRDFSTYLLRRLGIDAGTDDVLAVLTAHEAEVEAIFNQFFTLLEQGMRQGDTQP